MWRDKSRGEFVTSGQNFEECENSIQMRAWFEKLNESGNIIAKVWTWLAAQIREILRSKPETKVDDESVILMRILTSCKNHPRSIRNHYLGWKMVGESEFYLKIVRGSTQSWKLVKLWAGTPNIWDRPPGAHNRIFPDHYFENVETSGWDTALWS